MKIGDIVTLVPTQGSYQVEHTATVVRWTAKQVKLSGSETLYGLFWRDTGMPVRAWDLKQFPVYRIKEVPLI